MMLVLARTVILGSESHGTHDHVLVVWRLWRCNAETYLSCDVSMTSFGDAERIEHYGDSHRFTADKLVHLFNNELKMFLYFPVIPGGSPNREPTGL
jgi:hypothetical protein